jgi:DNA/RNA-binding domain of Phe-tRNA-synthetase-like protein
MIEQAANPTEIKVKIEPEISKLAPDYTVSIIECTVVNTESNEDLWFMIETEFNRFISKYKIEDVNKLPGIFEMRQLYKNTGKDPNRYRPSSEALCRRILNQKGLYKINTLVDIINYVSIISGFSIGGFDHEKIVGKVSLGIGSAGEKFEAIGRGLLNIEGLPVYRDEAGCIGTPTSDEERTKITMKTKEILIIIHSPAGMDNLVDTTELMISLLQDYAKAFNLRNSISC